MNACMVIIEGLIGVGKSTLTSNIGKALGFKVFKEPVEDNPYLEDFYKNPKRYALEMQFWLMSRRFQMHQEAIEYIWRTGKGVIMDRSIYGDAIFARQNVKDGNISPLGYDNYLKMRDTMFRFLMVPQLTLFLQASPKTCLKRISMRDRDCEIKIPLEYLAGLDEEYKHLRTELAQKGSRVEIIDWENFKSTEEVLAGLIAKNLLPPNFDRFPIIKETSNSNLFHVAS